MGLDELWKANNSRCLTFMNEVQKDVRFEIVEESISTLKKEPI